MQKRYSELSDDHRGRIGVYNADNSMFYVRQLSRMLASDMWPRLSTEFPVEMDELVKRWTKIRAKDAGQCRKQ
jgi:hypothetical protein